MALLLVETGYQLVQKRGWRIALHIVFSHFVNMPYFQEMMHILAEDYEPLHEKKTAAVTNALSKLDIP